MTSREAFIRSGRSEKVAKMVTAIDAQAERDGFDPAADAQKILDQLRALPTAHPRSKWHAIQIETGNRRKDPPSLETINAVLEVFERREIAAARFDEPPSGYDPIGDVPDEPDYGDVYDGPEDWR